MNAALAPAPAPRDGKRAREGHGKRQRKRSSKAGLDDGAAGGATAAATSTAPAAGAGGRGFEVYARETRFALLRRNPTMDGTELSDKVDAGWKDLDPTLTAYYAGQAGADECSGDDDSASSSAGFGSIDEERIFAAMTSFNRCRRRFVASSRCVGWTVAMTRCLSRGER